MTYMSERIIEVIILCHAKTTHFDGVIQGISAFSKYFMEMIKNIYVIS